MKLRDFFFAKGKITQAAESVSAPVAEPEELTLDLSVLLAYQERVVRSDIQEKTTSRRRETRVTPFPEYIKQLVEQSIEKNNLAFEVKLSGNRIYLETPAYRMIFMNRLLLRALLEGESETPLKEQQYNLFDKPLELIYSGSRNYLILVKSVHDWGIRTDTSDGPRSFNWEKIEGANYSLLLDKLPFDSTYKLKETRDGFAIRWSLETY